MRQPIVKATSLPKSKLYCSISVRDNMNGTITNIWGVQYILGTRKCLGLSSMIGRDKNATFKHKN